MNTAPVSAADWFSLGLSLVEQCRYGEALAAYNHAIALDERYALAWLHRGNVLVLLERSAEALAAYDRAIALSPTYAPAHFNRAQILRSLGAYGNAIASYNQAERHAQNESEQAQYTLAKADIFLQGQLHPSEPESIVV